MVFLLIILWIIFGIIVAKIATNKGYNGQVWFVYGMSTFLVAFVHVLLISGRGGEKDWRGRVACEHCAEYVRPEAKICPHCKSPFSPVKVSKSEVKENSRREAKEAVKAQREAEKARKEAEERALLEADPNYQKNLAASKAWDEKMRRRKTHD